MSQLEVRTEPQLLVGTRDAVDAQVARLARERRLVAKGAPKVVGRNRVEVWTHVLPAEPEPVAVSRWSPPWVVGGLASGGVFLAGAGYLLSQVVHTLVLLVPLLLGLVVVLVVGAVVVSAVGGDRFTQIMNIKR
jgi:hypothetical protein